jgi:hypothetical protein
MLINDFIVLNLFLLVTCWAGGAIKTDLYILAKQIIVPLGFQEVFFTIPPSPSPTGIYYIYLEFQKETGK